MVKWSTVTNPRGVFTSPIYSVTNNLDRYVATIKTDVTNIHNQTINYYFRVSYNTVDWTDWVRFYETSYDLLDDYKLKGLYFQYKIVMQSENDSVKPYLKSIDIKLEPFAHVENLGDMKTLPKLWIRKKNGKGAIALINHTTKQRIEFSELNNAEEIYIDCENEEIVSSNQHLGVYRYDSHNDEYLNLIRGENYLTSEGDFDLDIRHKAILLQE